MKITKRYLKDLTYQINGAAIEVHKALGPGLLESVYHKCMKHELTLRGISYQSEFSVPINYKGIRAVADLRCDLWVENAIAVELKSVAAFHPVHNAQLMTYLRLLKSPKGILYNFNVVNLYKDGQKTIVTNLFRNLPD